MKRFCASASFFLILMGVIFSTGAPNETVLVVGMSDIREQLAAYALTINQAPIEPRHDPVWAFVPGLYGLEVDIEMSYQNMLSAGRFDPSLVIMRAIPFEGRSEDFRQHRMYKGNEQGDYVSLLINVAWGAEELVQMLDILETYDIRASLFFEGKFAKNHPELVQNAHERGHIIGNHSYSHPANWLNLGYSGFQEEIVQTNDILKGIIAEDIIFFAPPGGAFTDETVRAAYDQGMYTILWSADTIDWRGDAAHVLIDRVMRRITPGGLILTHPKPETVRALPTMIERLQDAGYTFKRIDEIISGIRILP